MKILNVISDFFLNFFLDFEVLHKFIHDDYFCPVLVFKSFSPQYDFYDVVNDIPVDNKSKTEHINRILGLNRIVGGNITVADCRHRIDTPIKSVKILYLPRKGVDGRICSS